MVKAPILLDESDATKCLSGSYVADFLYKVCSQEPEKAIRRNRIYQGKYYEDEARFHEKIDRLLYIPRRFIRSMRNRLNY